MMTTNNHRKLAKGFWPVLVLSAALSLPAVSVAAPSPNGKAHAAKEQKHDRNQVRKELQKNQRQAAKQHAEIRRDAQKRQAEVRRDAQKRQAELRRQAAQQRQAQSRASKTLRESQARRLELQRQAEIQRQAELRRQAQVQRQYRGRTVYRSNDRYVQQNRVYRNRVYRDDSYYRNRFGRYGYRSNGQQEHIDGFVVDDRGECVLLREHSTGQIFALAGNINDMREGDHIRYVGTHTYDEYCGTGYPTMEVREIKTVWQNDRHDYAIFDANRDGYYDRWADRHYGYNY